MKSPAYVAVLALLLGSVAASESYHHRRMVETLLRFGAENGGPKLLPALKKSHVGDIRALPDDGVIVTKYSFSLQSTTQNVDGVLANLTLSGLPSLKVGRNGKSLLASGTLSIDGQYSLYGTSSGSLLEGQGGISIKLTDYDVEASSDYTVIDESKLAINSVDIKLNAPSIKITYENLVLDMGATQFLNDLLRH
ncbi:uncharacterized protein LOC126336882 [Schistocerca gregaria]|uniref:uncharacterized protein LOC126336882 n=1 Tax=Schistocerca gregaria TaxID=7010 RepID=UPI00211E926A|nr:uncharacterized protein LOC126336882 [Schistocerca gregaria]